MKLQITICSKLRIFTLEFQDKANRVLGDLLLVSKLKVHLHQKTDFTAIKANLVHLSIHQTTSEKFPHKIKTIIN